MQGPDKLQGLHHGFGGTDHTVALGWLVVELRFQAGGVRGVLSAVRLAQQPGWLGRLALIDPVVDDADWLVSHCGSEEQRGQHVLALVVEVRVSFHTWSATGDHERLRELQRLLVVRDVGQRVPPP